MIATPLLGVTVNEFVPLSTKRFDCSVKSFVVDPVDWDGDVGGVADGVIADPTIMRRFEI